MEGTGRWEDPASPADGDAGSVAGIGSPGCSPAPASQGQLEAGGYPKRLGWGAFLLQKPC